MNCNWAGSSKTRWMDLFPIINNLPNGSSKFTEHPSAYRHLEAMDTHGGTSIHEPGRQAGGRCAGISTGTGSKPRGCSGRPFAGRRTAFYRCRHKAAGWGSGCKRMPPTFGVEPGLVIGVIAGGPAALQQAVEFAEDDWQQGWKDLEKISPIIFRFRYWHFCQRNHALCVRRTRNSAVNRYPDRLYYLQPGVAVKPTGPIFPWKQSRAPSLSPAAPGLKRARPRKWH